MNKDELIKFFNDRALAFNWWRMLSDETVGELLNRFYPHRNRYSITGREIHHIWKIVKL